MAAVASLSDPPSARHQGGGEGKDLRRVGWKPAASSRVLGRDSRFGSFLVWRPMVSADQEHTAQIRILRSTSKQLTACFSETWSALCTRTSGPVWPSCKARLDCLESSRDLDPALGAFDLNAFSAWLSPGCAWLPLPRRVSATRPCSLGGAARAQEVSSGYCETLMTFDTFLMEFRCTKKSSM